MYKHYFQILVAVTMLLCGHVHAADKLVDIGFAGPLTGLSSASGSVMLNAAKMAIDDANRANVRINGDRLVFNLLVQDDKSNPRIAEIAAKYFVKSGVVGVIGIYNSAVAISTSEIYQKAGIAHFSVASARRYTQQGHDTAFRLAAHNELRANVLASYIVQELQKNKIAIIHDDSVFGRDYKEKFTNAVNALGAKVVSVDSVNATNADFSDVLKNVKANQAEAIFFGGLGAQTALLAQNKHRIGLEIPLISAVALVGPQFLETAGPAAHTTISMISDATVKRNKQIEIFEKSYQQRYGTAIGPYAASAYDQVRVLVAAISAANSVAPRKVADALHSLRYEGLTGPIAFNSTGDLREITFSVYGATRDSWTLQKHYRIGADN